MGCIPVCQRSASADREVVLAAVVQDWRALEHASPELRTDREVVLAVVAQDGWAWSMAMRSGMIKVVLAVFAQIRVREVCRSCVLAAVAYDGWALQYASKALEMT